MNIDLKRREEMSIKWIKYPRPGTSVLAGRWLVTVETGATLTTDILQLEGGEWYWPDGSKLADRERVVAVAYVPEPYRPA